MYDPNRTPRPQPGMMTAQSNVGTPTYADPTKGMPRPQPMYAGGRPGVAPPPPLPTGMFGTLDRPFNIPDYGGMNLFSEPGQISRGMSRKREIMQNRDARFDRRLGVLGALAQGGDGVRAQSAMDSIPRVEWRQAQNDARREALQRALMGY